MPTRNGPAHIVTTRRAYKGKLYETHLLRRTYRQDGKVKNETLGNLSHLPASVIELVRRALRGETLVSADQAFEVCASPVHGDAQAVLRAIDRLGVRELLATRRCRESDVVIGMLAARVIAPHTKLATTRWWRTRTLAEDLGIADAHEDALYAAMDWLLERQGAIEQKLARRHLAEGVLALYDLSSSYFEGTHCPLAKRGHNRDGKRGKLQVDYGLLTNRRGIPVAVSVYEDNTTDAKTLLPQVRKLKDDFGLSRVVLVGDRGMIGPSTVEVLKAQAGVAWITALKSAQIRALIEGEALQLGLFDERNLIEFAHPDYPGERLFACRTPALAQWRAHTREALLQATAQELEKVRALIERGRLKAAGVIGVRAGRVGNKDKVAKHFELTIEERRFEFKRIEDAIAAADGLYVIRTSLTAAQMSAPEAVRSYKALAEVERAFRTLKTIELKVRPIHHRLADRVRAHILLCMLAYYVEWHMREAWRPLLLADEDIEAKATRDPVAPAKRSARAERKAATHTIEDESQAHSFRALMEELASIVRNTCRTPGGDGSAPTFQLITRPNLKQKQALDLIESITA